MIRISSNLLAQKKYLWSKLTHNSSVTIYSRISILDFYGNCSQCDFVWNYSIKLMSKTILSFYFFCKRDINIVLFDILHIKENDIVKAYYIQKLQWLVDRQGKAQNRYKKGNLSNYLPIGLLKKILSTL